MDESDPFAGMVRTAIIELFTVEKHQLCTRYVQKSDVSVVPPDLRSSTTPLAIISVACSSKFCIAHHRVKLHPGAETNEPNLV
jgi:hypothetical protein